MADPQQQTNGNGEVIDDEDTGGALSNIDTSPTAPSTAPPSKEDTSTLGSKSDQQQRLAESRAQQKQLAAQYGEIQKGLGGAYAAQAKALQDARDRILGLNLGPSDKEAAYMRASVGGEPGTGRWDPGAQNAMEANILGQQREAEYKKQQLLAQYGTQIPAAQIGQLTALENQNIQRTRINQSDINNANTRADQQVKPINKYFLPDPNNPNGAPVFNQGLYDADMQANKDKASIQAKAKLAAQNFQATGLVGPEMIDLAMNDMKSLPSAVLRNPAAMAQIFRGIHEQREATGDTAGSFWAEQQQNKEASKVLDDYSKGKTHAQLDGLNTAVSHLNVFRPAIDALNNGDNSWLNNVKNTWNQKVMGAPAPTDFNGIKEFVGGEIAKAVLPQGGGEAERQALSASVSSANSPQALKSIVDKWQQLLAGKTHYAKFNWDQSTQGKFGAFEDRFLLPETQRALGIQGTQRPAQPAPRPGQAPAAQPHPDDLLVQYYSDVAAAKAAGKPPPPKPAGL